MARRAMGAVEQGSREEWINLFAADATLEDPVDGSPGLTGTDAIANFWDTSIAMFEAVQFDVRRIHEAPGEAVVLAEISIRTPGGESAQYDAAIHYRVDDSGDISHLRAFWDLPDVMQQLSAT
ncbi:ketosteroid isomerase-like protein [Aeromicrobium panaciterrae]|uniref:Ketosteroid isomerase-like protein n=1 Tax=Aeromicrobium panaciterrae TaxID=363861 RepID=A0ABU1ULU3_9ACTN|nr:nuclear transport factor 2 family protein [Aeromicrobium panaciterrae]MDR7086128.1 ketosteroid isomerase-like protein [Aeromicrobium panaciterrae]